MNLQATNIGTKGGRMTRISVDDQISELALTPSQKLGDLLNDVLSTLPPNRIVTQILFDGRPLSQPNDPSVIDGLDSVGELQIRTVDRQMWSVNGLDIALSGLERVQRSLIRAAELFREDKKGEANRFFVHCVDGLERFIEAVTITRVAMKLDFTQVSVDDIKLSRLEQEFSEILKHIIMSQEIEDYVGVADKVEYELLPNLCGWAKAIRQLRTSYFSNA
jgi:hypothetical protein